MQQRDNRPHVSMDVERNERSLLSSGERDPLHIRMCAGSRGQQTLQTEDASLRQALHKSLRGGFILHELRLRHSLLRLREGGLKRFEE